MKLQLEGRRALVTGSSAGIGAEIARVLAEEGAWVVVHGRAQARARGVADDIVARGGRSAVVVGDLTDAAQSERVAVEAVAAFGGIDILVNNAGGASPENGNIPFFEVPVEHWAPMYDKNVVSTVRLIHLLVPAMRERGWGRVIQIASSAATTPPAMVAEYNSAKLALVGLTLSLSKALAKTGVTVNTVSPGIVRTPTFDDWMLGVGAGLGFGDDIRRTERYVLDNFWTQTVDRVGEVDDIANLVAYVASPLSGYINGTNLRVDGGISPAIN
ncbi:MAG: family NAD(P)-dependent oxidoreductase [Hydrocarboniphaga sp.]|uniref:SDR family NAD(P)-dependent oxidoreductase n=1 Tax=Hydrocarboniphaga sp. TaxID=2033016 RepID=UPI002610610A|nr:SDR family NAD(P)-dependent oxidoreductase [Hydrocarboniphaga sp.]MDB5971377.1 family NAD(P)-dependent oxidoreductase [Hydrocarboniphaga sp.]